MCGGGGQDPTGGCQMHHGGKNGYIRKLWFGIGEAHSKIPGVSKPGEKIYHVLCPVRAIISYEAKPKTRALFFFS